MEIQEWKDQLLEQSRWIGRSDRLMLALQVEILSELRAIRQATEQANEPVPDDEPDPYQTLNGPSSFSYLPE